MNAPASPASKSQTQVQAGPADAELVRRIQQGDRMAFRVLFDRYHRRAFAVAVGVVKNQEDAMDVVQDAFVKVHKHIGRFQGSSSFYTWLYRIVMNLGIDHLRRGKNISKVALDERVGAAAAGPLLSGPADGSPTRTVARRELTQQIQTALQSLPTHHRAVLVLREIEGLSYEQMAEVLEVPKGTIMSRLFHARRKMQAALGPYLEGELEIGD
ncbi:MAG: sigma-70 family RNA polymerase sigma factor [Proteobacteria bacterium]|nr:sigma-70 family RNA polymerase sigma factor [Pseudomonadota bacterium]